MTEYTPPESKPKIKVYPYNKVTVTWSHGFQHSFVCIGYNLKSQLASLDKLEYVTKHEYVEITKEEYEAFYGGTILDDEEDKKEVPVKTSKKKNSMPQFSSLENFFDDKKVEKKKGPAKKTAAKRK